MDYNRMMSMSMFLEKGTGLKRKFTYQNLLLPYGFLVKMCQNAISVGKILVFLNENITVGFVVGFLCELC